MTTPHLLGIPLPIHCGIRQGKTGGTAECALACPWWYQFKRICEELQEHLLQGSGTPPDDAIGESGVRKVFLMMGQNDLGYMTVEDTMDNWDKLLARIFEQSPDVEIYIQSLIPEWIDSGKDNSKNDKIDQYNLKLKKYCQEKGYHFIEIANYIKDHTNRMATVYSMDQSIHINYEGTAVWMDVLKAYAKLQELQGETT